MLQKDETVLATGDRIYGLLNWAYIRVMSMEKIFAPLNLLASVCIYRCVIVSKVLSSLVQ